MKHRKVPQRGGTAYTIVDPAVPRPKAVARWTERHGDQEVMVTRYEGRPASGGDWLAEVWASNYRLIDRRHLIHQGRLGFR